jgi:peptidoglycan hydrolase-like protein with peptidoglycan-binding domain
MRPAESFISQPIRSLQTMLRVIAHRDPSHQTVIPDGIYGPATVSAVSTFQRKHGLPITGVADQTTWESVVAIYDDSLIHMGEAESVDIILNPNQVIRKGERHPNLLLAQAMLRVLSEVYASIGMPSGSGILDEATADSISSFQALNGLPMSGNLDKRTWKHLALHYPLAANLQISR